MIQKNFWFILIFFGLSCSYIQKSTDHPLLNSGIWRGALDIGSQEIPFLFEVSQNKGDYQFTIVNGEERIITEAKVFSGDSLKIMMPVFNSEFRLKAIAGNRLQGFWQNFNKTSEYIIPFTAEHGNHERFPVPPNPLMGQIEHKWEVTFSPESEKSSPAIGLFDVDENGRALGSFATETGDYRFLDGLYCDSLLLLSCFDGAHAFLFKARLQPNGQLLGDFWSGHSWHETWLASVNPQFELSHPDSLTQTIVPDDKISFSFRGLDRDTVSLTDDKYRNKVVMIQVFGSWCPNCADESIYYQKLYDKYNKDGLEIIGLAFESSRDYEMASENVYRFRKNLGLNYDMAIAGYYSKKEAAETLGFLNHVLSFPTTVILDRTGRVQKIHTGFYGPGTGDYYDNYMLETEAFIQSLL